MKNIASEEKVYVMVKDLERIIRHYGTHNQIEKTKEELEEMIEALDENNFAHIVEEFADVMVMLNQIAIMYAIDTDIIEDMMKYKIRRTLLRIREEKNDTKRSE